MSNSEGLPIRLGVRMARNAGGSTYAEVYDCVSGRPVDGVFAFQTAHGVGTVMKIQLEAVMHEVAIGPLQPSESRLAADQADARSRVIDLDD